MLNRWGTYFNGLEFMHWTSVRDRQSFLLRANHVFDQDLSLSDASRSSLKSVAQTSSLQVVTMIQAV
jgi:hypothetical protein